MGRVNIGKWAGLIMFKENYLEKNRNFQDNFFKKKQHPRFLICWRRGLDTLWEPKKFQKKFWADPRFEQNVFWRLLGPDDTQSDQSQKFFLPNEQA